MTNRLMDGMVIKKPGRATVGIYSTTCVLHFIQFPRKLGHGSSTASCCKASTLESLLTASAHTCTHTTQNTHTHTHTHTALLPQPLEVHTLGGILHTALFGVRQQWVRGGEKLLRKGGNRERHFSELWNKSLNFTCKSISFNERFPEHTWSWESCFLHDGFH